MATPISGGTSFDFGAAPQAAAAQPKTTNTAAAAEAKQASKTDTKAYTVKLSEDAQVRLLKTQGQSVSQISVITDLSAKAVDGYLEITQAPPTGTATSK
jgi:hypothetical protein